MPSLGFFNTNLPPHLRVLKDEIEAHARAYGLDFYETIFEVIDADDLNEIAAYGGFPTRYPHWSFGMQYEELKKGYEYGLSKIYEMVINNDPCYAYLMRSNHIVDQKLVMAHVYGHCDFFKNNLFFSHTTRKMMDEIANHAARIRGYVERFGENEVESFLDRCMSLDDLIDIHSVAIKRRDTPTKFDFQTNSEDDVETERPVRFKAKPYMDEYLNPTERLHDDASRTSKQPDSPNFPDHPEKDVLLFLIEHAPLKNWQRDILSIIRDEAYYFYPQAQTKILNEGWACVVGDTLIPTNQGFIKASELVQQRLPALVADGTTTQAIIDWVKFPQRETVRIRTRRGFILEGSRTHQIQLGPDSWKQLGEVQIGDAVPLARGTNLWAQDYVRCEWQPQDRMTIEEVCVKAGVSVRTLYRHLNGKRVKSAAILEPLVLEHREQLLAQGMTQLVRRKTAKIPQIVDEHFGSFLGYLIGDGHISTKKRTLGLTTGDESQADHFTALVEMLFDVKPRKKWDETKWRIKFSSQTVQELLLALGLKSGVSARIKTVPDCILRSPRSVVSAFIRALFDCDGYAGPAGVILSTSSTTMSETVQQLLLNFGILSTRRPHKDGCWHVQVAGASTKNFSTEIGFGLARKQQRLEWYIEHRQWFCKENETDAIVEITHGQADVFDFTIENSHRYAAGGMMNHNSFWHSTIMTQKVLEPSEVIDYADHHSGTMATSGGRLNPYKLGIELLRDIERRWNTGQFGEEWENCENETQRRDWNKPTNLGRAKIFEVRKIHNDITFIDTFLTPEFCKEHKLFSFNYQDPTRNYVIESREFQQVKQRLLQSLTNFGKPWIEVINGNHRNRGELLLRHKYNGVELKQNEAHDTLVHLRFIWGRPVHLLTVIDDKSTIMSFDGNDHSQQEIGVDDVTRDAIPY